jgi:hypothetical protein
MAKATIYPKAGDTCHYCRVEDANSNCLIYEKVVKGWVCENCIDDIIERKTRIMAQGMEHC